MMNEATTPMTPVTPAERAADRRLIAPLWHTAVLIAILLAIAAYGAYMQSTARAGPQLVAHRGSALPIYLSLLVAEWGLLRFVTAGGLRRTGTRLRDLLGERWSGWRDVARDVAIALAVWAMWTAIEAFVAQRLGSDTAKGIDSLLPRDPLEVTVWVALSLTAGFCEETVFRGYLQTQFRALTGSVPLAVLLQAVIFGISHGYQGLRNVIAISVFGALFGVLAWWRRSLKPGIILHAWTDIFSGIFSRRG
jgi:membrane protease YdiL (CAAX protease family)